MRDMNEDEKKVFDRKMDYLGKLKDSMPQEEMDALLPKEIQEIIDAPRFSFSGACFYPRQDFNDYLEASYTGSPMSERMAGLEDRVKALSEELEQAKQETEHAKREADGYATDIDRLENELKEAKAKAYKNGPGTDSLDGLVVGEEGSASKLVNFYHGEIVVLNMEMVLTWMQNHRPQTPSSNLRAYQLAKELRDSMMETFDTRKAEAEAKSFRESIEKAVEECFSTSPTDIRPLLSLGFRDRTRKNSPHWKFAYLGMDDYTFTMSKTPSDSRAVEKCKAELVQRLCL